MSKLIEIVTTASVVSLLVVSSAWAGKEIPTIAGVGIQRDRVVVSTHTKSSIMLPEKDLVPAVFELLPAEGIDPSLFFGVEASGYIRKVSVDGEIAAGQVVITSVSKNGQYAKISDEGLNAQFDASSQTTVVPESMLEVGGSRTALIRALEHLRSTTMASGGKTSSSESHDDSSGGSSSSVGKSAHDFSSKSSKSDAKPKADAKATTPVVDDKSKQAPQVVANSASIKETTDGCSIRVDIEKGIAIQQSKIEFSSSMKISDEAKPYVGVCADSSKTYSLIKNYDTCPDIIDLETHSATPQYTLTYDLDGSIQTVLQCTKDDIPYQIIQDTKSCEPKIDGSSGKTTPQARLIYHNRAGEVIEVRGCADSDGSYSTSRNYDTCPDIIEQELRIAIPQYTLTHTQDGVTKTIGECTKDESSYPIIQDTKSCEPKIDAIAGQAIPQARLIYHNRSGKAIEVRGCADSDNSYALLKEYDTCPDIIDLDKLIAWSQYKKIHVDKGDVKVISQCTKDEEVPYKITEEEKGCKPRIDLPNLLAIPQVKLVYNNRRGETLEARGCEDAKDKKPYDIVKNYHICSDVLDLDAKEAWPSYIAYYIDDKGETQNIGECIRDDVPYKIIEETNRCQPRVDLEKKLAIPQSLLSYKNRDDVVIEARGCAASTIEKPIKLRPDSKSCTLRHDFDAGFSFVRSSYFYKYKGKTYQASECIDTDKTYKHFKVTWRVAATQLHYDAERISRDFGCRRDGSDVYRIAINIDNKSNEPFYISDCIARAVPGGVGVGLKFEFCPGASGYELQRDTMECHPLGRSYTLDPSTGQKTYTSGCRRYVGHSMQPACLVGDMNKWQYEHNDQDFYSLPFVPYGCKDELHNLEPGTGRDLGPRPTYGQIYHITEPMAVLGNMVRYNYVLEGEVIKPTGKIKYRGCKAFDIARKFKKFRRIDNSYYELATDEIVEQNERDVCDSITTEREFKTGYKCGGGTPIEDTFGTVLKTTRTNRENKAVIGEVCKFKTTYNERRQLSTEPNLPGCSDPHNPVEHQTLTVPPCPF